jgi:hypothetical protein
VQYILAKEIKHMAEDARVVFTDGFVFHRKLVIVSSQLLALEEYDHSRIFKLKDGSWSRYDVDTVVRSVCGTTHPEAALFSLGRDGRIDIATSSGLRSEFISDAGVGPGKFGYLNMIREVAGKLYACGVSGQIYTRDPRGWIHFDRGVLESKDHVGTIDIYAVHGTSNADIYAVGSRGTIYRFDGQSWSQRKAPTVSDLNWVHCVAPDEVYLCGDRGVVFRGFIDDWENLSASKFDKAFWCIEKFEGRMYLAASRGLYMLDGRGIVPVETNLSPRPDGGRLHSADGVLWSFGNKHLCFFDGKSWTYVKHPDNP